MIIVDHNFSVPLDYEKDSSKKISIFVREIVRAKYENKELPYLIFFQGGPGYESPRPITDSGWIKRASEEFRVLFLDERLIDITEESGDSVTVNNVDKSL